MSQASGTTATSTLSLIEEEMQRSYLDYAMSVIVSRALPDVRDGLKPVHRRILFAMKESGYTSSHPFRKSARIVGDVMGKYHPHGDTAIYDAMVRMAQVFSLRLPLIDSQGNFGSMDGDPAAAMRYTEARLNKAAETLLADIDKETVDFYANYDDSLKEPSVLPARYPNLLVNGAGGIAVGMATNIPPHNLGEVIDGCVAFLDNPSLSLDELMRFIPAPDFPTGGRLFDTGGVRSSYDTGRGLFHLCARTSIEPLDKSRSMILITEIPYQVNKSRLMERIAEVVREKIVEGIGDLRDESDKDGVRVVIELKRGHAPEVVLAQLFKHTPLQVSFSSNVLALQHGKPETLSLLGIIRSFVAFRDQVITRRTTYELRKARARAHILLGLLIAIDHIDAVIKIIRSSKTPEEARTRLQERPWDGKALVSLIRLLGEGEAPSYNLTAQQAHAILELQLQRLTNLERDKLVDESHALASHIESYIALLNSQEKRHNIIRQELLEIRAAFATPRKTEIERSGIQYNPEDLIQKEDMVITVTKESYIKRVALATYKTQNRGGQGRSGINTREDDAVDTIFLADTHTGVLFFSSSGVVYCLKVHQLPLGSLSSRGRALINLLPLSPGENISTVMPLPSKAEALEESGIVFVTKSGYVRRNRLMDFMQVPRSGKRAMKLDEGDALVKVHLCQDNEDVFLATRLNMVIRFPVKSLRVFAGHASKGVRGIALDGGDEIVSMALIPHTQASPEERKTYLSCVIARNRLSSPESALSDEERARDEQRAAMLSQEPWKGMMRYENFILSVSSQGLGQLCSHYGYRLTLRGGRGVGNMSLRREGETIVASCPVDPSRQDLLLVTDGGKVIRIPLKGVRVVGRKSVGVKLLKVAEGHSVVSAEVISCHPEEGDVQPPASSL